MTDKETRQDIDIVVRRHGLTIDDLVRCGKGGLEAVRTIKDRDGDLVDEVPDWNVRHKFFSSFMELLGYIKGQGVTVNNVTQIMELDRDKEEKFQEWKARCEEAG
jgi:hypothetical protein